MDIVDTKTALLAAINAAGLTLATVAAFSTRHINDESGDIVVIKPAALLVYGGSTYTPHNVPSTFYDDPQQWEIVIVTEDLSGGDNPSAQALAIIDALKKKMGGLKLTAGAARGFVKLTGTEALLPWQNGLAKYSILLTVETDFVSAP